MNNRPAHFYAFRLLELLPMDDIFLFSHIKIVVVLFYANCDLWRDWIKHTILINYVIQFHACNFALTSLDFFFLPEIFFRLMNGMNAILFFSYHEHCCWVNGICFIDRWMNTSIFIFIIICQRKHQIASHQMYIANDWINNLQFSLWILFFLLHFVQKK